MTIVNGFSSSALEFCMAPCCLFADVANCYIMNKVGKYTYSHFFPYSKDEGEDESVFAPGNYILDIKDYNQWPPVKKTIYGVTALAINLFAGLAVGALFLYGVNQVFTFHPITNYAALGVFAIRGLWEAIIINPLFDEWSVFFVPQPKGN